MANRLPALLFVVLCSVEIDLFAGVEGSNHGAKSKAACENYSKKAKPVLTPLTFGGVNAVLGEYPHVATLGLMKEDENEYQFNCAGSLISEDYVITAAHCVVNRFGWKLKIVRLGVVDVPKTVKKPDPKLDYNVIDIKVHKDYNVGTYHNDIALVRLEKVNVSDDVRPACLHTEDEVPERMVVTGWGTTHNRERSNILQMATVSPIPLQECNNTFSKFKRSLIGKQICAVHKGGDDPCKSQSGGPLQGYTEYNIWTVVGIASFRSGCIDSSPGVYTRINSYLYWIEKIVWP